MMRFTLRCDDGHEFESWFAGNEAFLRLKVENRVICPACGSSGVEKALMAPRVTTTRKKGHAGPAEAAPTEVPAVHSPPPEIAKAIARIREHVEKHSEHVGDRFAAEARAMYLGDLPERPIHGQASAKDARELIEDGVPVLPLPFTPRERTN